MCCFGQREDEFELHGRIERQIERQVQENRPGRQQNPAWDAKKPYGFQKSVFDDPAGKNGAAGPSQQGGYQPNQGMSHQVGSRQDGGQNNPYGTGRSTTVNSQRNSTYTTLRSGTYGSRSGAYHHDNNNSNTSRGRTGADASSMRTCTQGAATTAMNTTASGNNPDNIPGRTLASTATSQALTSLQTFRPR